jgi:hypothetical protein
MKFCDVGCDVDGVLAHGFIPPEPEFTVISGRTTDDWERTIGQVGTTRPIYLRPPGFPGEAGEWKAVVIRTVGIRRFYEDMPDQAAVIRRICPDCTVVLVKRGQVVETLS